MLKNLLRNAFLLIVALTMLLAGCGNTAGNTAAVDSGTNIDSQLIIKAIDVDQGDAYLIQTGAQVILIDTGDDKYRDGEHKGENNNKLFEALDREGITHINKLIVTHAHADHMGCATKVMKKYDVDEYIYNGIPSASAHFRNALKTAKARGVNQTTVQAGDVLDFGKGVLFRVLSPSPQLVDKDTKALNTGGKVNVNNESIVGILSFGNFTMMFTGDAEKDIEKELLEKYGDGLACKVYKTPHHGSHTSSSFQFVKAVHPEWGIISCGKGNSYGHPHKEVRNLFKRYDIKYLTTAESGTITIISDGNTYSVTGEQ